MECEYCENHFCSECLQMNDKEYDHHINSSGMWFCIACKPKVEETLKIEKEIEKRCEEHFKKYSKRLDEIERKLESKVELGDVVALINEKSEVDKANHDNEMGTKVIDLKLSNYIEKEEIVEKFKEGSTVKVDHAKTSQKDFIDLVNKQVEKKSMADIVRQQLTQPVSEEDVIKIIQSKVEESEKEVAAQRSTNCTHSSCPPQWGPVSNNTVAKGFNQMAPPARTITVALDMSKAFDTVNTHTLIGKLLQTSTPGTILKFVANYIKGRKAYTSFRNHKSIQRQVKTGVPQGGVLSPTLFNIHTADIPTPTAPVQVMLYADDITITSTHTSMSAARKYIQPYLHKVYDWTQHNNLIINPDKTTCTLFTPDPAEYNSNLGLNINNKALPMALHPKVLGLTLDPKLTSRT